MIQIDTERYERDGYLIIRGIFQGERLRALRARADAFVDECWAQPTLAGQRRLDLIQPPPASPPVALLEAIADPWVLGVSEVIQRSALVANTYQMSVDSVDMYWHRDQVFLPKEVPWDIAGYHAEVPFSQIQWNLPLLDDDYLHIIPGSHRRHDPGQDALAARSQAEGRFIAEMPGALTVRLAAGDGVVYNNNLLHGVRRPAGQPVRRTLHWYWTLADHADPYGWRQPDLSACRDLLPARIRETYARCSPPAHTSPHWRGERRADGSDSAKTG